MVKERYKQTEVGVIPEDWEVTCLDSVSKLSSGTTPSRAQEDRYYRNGEHHWVKTTDLNNSQIKTTEEKVTKAALNETCLQIYPPGTVLVAMYGGFNQIGRTGLIRVPAAVNQALVAIQAKPNKLDPAYLLANLNYRVEHWKSVASSSRKDPNITSQDVRNFVLPLPKPEEQRSIAQALSDVDALIAALDKAIAKKRAIKTTTMQQLLTGKKRLPGFGEGKGYQQTEVGTIPEDWNVRALGNLGKFKNGINKGSEDFGHGSPFVNLMDVFGISSISEVKHLGLVNSNDAEKKVYDLKEGDVLFIRSSVKPSGVGLTTIITRDLPSSVYSGFLIRFRDDGKLETDFKKYCFSEEKFRKRVIASSTISANTNINQDNLKQLSLAYPESSVEQRAIATVLSDMDTEIAALETRLAKTQALKQGMMQALLTGRIRLA